MTDIEIDDAVIRHLWKPPLAALLATVFISAGPPVDRPPPTGDPTPSVFFAPGDDCESHIVSFIDAAKHTLRVQAYGFTSRPIANALIAAHKRGVDVAVILDHSDDAKPIVRWLQDGGVRVLLDYVHAIAHNKVMVRDGAWFETGSFNYTVSAQRHNAENVYIDHNPDIGSRYLANWDVHAEHSVAP